MSELHREQRIDLAGIASRIIGMLVLLAVLRAGTTARAQPNETNQQWSGFRGPTGMGIAASDNLPVEWNRDKNVAWKTTLPGSGTSSPIVFGDRIYVTTYSGYNVPGKPKGDVLELKRHLVAINKHSGKIVGTVAVNASQPEEAEIRDHGYSANTPVAAEEGVYVFFGKTGVIAFDHRGNERWRADVGDKTHGWGSGASLVLYEDLLIVNASVESESLIALDRATGRERWRMNGMRESWNTPVIVRSNDGPDELVVVRFGEVLALQPSSGKVLWSCKNDIQWYIVPSIVADDGVIYSLGGRSGTTGIAVRSGGTGDVTGSHRLWSTRDGTNVPSPVIKDGYLYWASHDGGIAYCCNASTGELAYQERVDRMGQVYASPILSGDRIYYVDRSGKTFVVAAEPEFRLLAKNDLSDNSRFDASPAVDGDSLLIRSGNALYCIE